MPEVISLEEAKRRYPPTWTIYQRPLDFPNHFVVRLFYGEVLTQQFTLHPDLDQARRQCLFNGASLPLARHPYDDAFIVETWI